MKKIRVICCAAAAALAAAGAAYSAAPALLSYQGTLRKDGRLFNGPAAMEFRITDQAGVTEYWTSGSTDVVVSTGLFRYALGSPNEAQFASIVWKDITPYVQMKLEGSWLPPEPLYSSAYSMHALTAESSTGTFTVNDGSLRITGAAGANGVVFPNGTVQYGAPGWEVSVNGIYTSFPGRAGVGVSTPSFSLDVKGGPGDAYVQLWRDSSETIVASMSATGQLYADAAMLRNMPSGNVVDTLSATLAAGNNAGGTAMVNVGSVTVASALGAAIPRVYLAAGVEISSAPQAAYGGVQISTNVYLPPGAKYYGDGSGLTGVNAADNLGDHTASQPLDMSGFAVVGASAVVFSPEVALSSGSAAQYGGLLVSTNVYLPAGAKYYGDGSGLTGIGAASGNLVDNLSDTLGAGNNAGGYSMLNVGNLALGAGAAGTRLDVQGGGGGYTQFWRNSGGVIVASMTDTGVIYADASKMRGLPAADNLGDHTLAQNLLVGAYWLSGDGGNEGVSVNASGNVGVGVNPATVRLEVNDADANTLTSGMKFTNFACSGSDKLTVDVSGNLVCSVDQTGSGTGNIVDNLADTLNSGRDAGGFGITGLGNVAIGAGSAGTRLDVQGGGGGYTQFWRDSGGVIVASMTDTGVIYADASKMRGLPSADNLGDHTLAQNLRAGTYWLSGDGGNEGVSVNASGNVGVGINPATARFEVNDADADTATSGMKFTNFSCAGTAKLTVDVSGNLVCAADQLGSNVIDTLSATLSAGNDAGGLNILNAGMITAGGQLTVYSSATVTGAYGLGSPRLRFASNVEISSAPASAYGGVRVSTNIYAAGSVYASKFYGDGSQLTNIPTGNVVDSLSATLGVDNDAGGTGMVNLGGVGIGIVAPGASLDVKGGGGLAQLWRSPAGVVVASMTDSGVLYADASGMRNLPSGGGGNVVDTLADTLGAGNNAGGASMLNVGNLALGSGAAGTRLDVQGGGGGYTQFWRDSGGVIVASMTDTGVIYADASKMRGLPAADNLGDHTLAQNLLVGAYWLSGDGGNEGVSVNASGNVGVGVNPATARLEVNDADANTLTSGMKFTNFSCSGSDKLTVDGSGNLVCSVDQTGSGTGNIVDNLADTLNSGRDAGGFGITGLGNVAIGAATAGTRLDVQGGGDGYTQFWRNSGGVIVASMTDTGVIYADASKMRGLPSADNLGDHTLAQNLRAGTYWLSGDGGNEGVSVNASGNVGVGINPATARFEVNDADSDTNTSGVKFTNFSCAGTAKLTVDVSGNLICATDQTGSGSGNIVDTLSATLGAGNNAGGTGMVNLGDVALGAGAAGTRLDVQGGGGGYTQFWRNSGGVIVASMTDTGVLYADASGIRGIPGGNVVDTLAATLGAGNDAGGAAVKNLGDVSVGAGTAVSTLSASGFLGLANLSGQPSGAGYGSLYYNPAAFSGQGALYLNLNGAFVPVATGTVAGGGGMTGVISNANQFSGDGAGVGTSLTLKSSSVTLQGNSFNGAGQLVRLDGAGKLPAVDGSQLTSLPVDTIAAALGAGSNAGGTGITNLGNVAIGAVSAGTSLDVKGGGGYVQFWRDSGGVIVASMTDTGVLYADASGIRGLSGGGNVIDTLDATLTAGGDAGGKTMVNLGDVAIGAASAATRLDVQGGGDGNVQFWRNAAGVVVASMTDTGVMFMDGSGVRNLGSGNVVDTLVATLGAGNSAGGTGITNLGNVAVGGAVAGTRLDVRGSGDGYTQFWRNSGGVVVASMTDTGVLYADASGIRGLPSGGGNVVDTLAATLGAGNDAGGAAMKNLGDVSVGAGTAVSTLSASGFLGLANLSSQPSGAGAGAMYYNPSAFSGQGALYVNFNGAFLPIATGTVAGGGGLTGVVSDSNQFSGDGAGPGTSLTLKSSSVTLQGNAFNGSGQLVKLDGAGRLPAVDGSMLTSLPAGAGAESCTNPNDPSDILVQVGDFCVDKYEASVWSGPTGGTQYGIASDNYPCGDDGQNCLPGSNPVYARSVSGVTPSSYVTWFQASAACTNAGKHLITNAEWQAAVTGTPKTGSGIAPGCNFADTGPTATGAGTNCRSYYDVENMVGSLWEMVSDWGMYTANAQFDAWAAGDDGAGGPSASPVAVTLRGGAFNVPSPYTGPKTFYMGAAPNSAGDGTIGFRCAMRLR